MNCQTFLEQLEAGTIDERRPAEWQQHWAQCRDCRELYELAVRLHDNAPSKATSAGAAAEVAAGIYRRATRRVVRRRVAALGTCAILLMAAWTVYQHLIPGIPRNSGLPDSAPRAVDVARNESARVDAENITVPLETDRLEPQDLDRFVSAAAAGGAQVRKAVIRVRDASGKLRDVDVLVVESQPRPVGFDQLSPLERQLMRRYLQLQGQATEFTHL